MAESMTNHQQAFGDLLWRRIVIVLPYLWLILFFLVPFAIVFKISFSDPIVAQPPFTPLFDQSQSFLNWFQGSLNNYLFLLEDNLYWVSYLRSIKVAFISTICCLLLGYPMAYYIAQSAPTKRNVLLMLIILPFWTSFLLRVYAWMGILSTNGIINSVFLWIGVIDEPIQMLYTNFAVYLGIVYTYLPFMILPLYANLERLDLNLHDAAADLGGKPLQVFWDITLPVSLPGVIAGSLLVFIPAMGEFVIPALLGGLDSLMIGRTLYDEFFVNRDWPLASAVASILLLILVLPMVLFQRNQAKSAEETS
ncbi:MAG: putrescine ABC transporter permease PotH [Gammaproteobacteria bacterium]|nr:putrescine ABC transporter permease PotH [Gammaproteobacteria bacterium]MED5529914.1 ABC transporter permease subunit [Pseudomonadota bacterium]HAI15993.1 putrescine ABC transporter permease PotH [Gammaproteobacteria bacterium]|tara:strand:- start:3516 stop:4439 length:924 start_codon:yes stop_codon:yes gene_type:complete